MKAGIERLDTGAKNPGARELPQIHVNGGAINITGSIKHPLKNL